MPTTSAIASAGARLYVSSRKPVAFDIAGYEALSWTEIKEIVELGAIGRTYVDVISNPISDQGQYHLKGRYDEGGLSVKAGHASSDPGQAILQAASTLYATYYIKLQYAGSVEVEYFPAKVFPGRKQIGGANAVVAKSYDLIIDGSIVTDDSGAGTTTSSSFDELTVDELDALTVDEIDSLSI